MTQGLLSPSGPWYSADNRIVKGEEAILSLTTIRACAPQLRISLTSVWPIFFTRTRHLPVGLSIALLLGLRLSHRPCLSVGGHCARDADTTYLAGADFDECTAVRRAGRYDFGPAEGHRTAGRPVPRAVPRRGLARPDRGIRPARDRILFGAAQARAARLRRSPR